MRASTVLFTQAPGLLQELLRVRRALQRRRATLPWKLELLLTYSCGSRCKTCLIWTRYERAPQDRARELPPEAFAKVARSVAPHLRWISFTGGEITDRADAGEIVAQVTAAAPRCRVLSFTSHGLNPEPLLDLLQGLAAAEPRRAILVTLSLDGLGETYKKIRGVDGAGQVLDTMDRLQRLRRQLPNLAPSFQTTLSERNLDELDSILRLVSERAEGNVVTVASDSKVLTEGKIKGVEVRLDPRLPEALARAEARTRATGLSAAFSKLYLRMLRQGLAAELAPIPCTAGLASLTITPYGEVLQCDRHDEPLGILGPPDFDLRALIASPGFAHRLAPLIGCRECFTPCQAYPSMMHLPLRSLSGLIGRGAAR